MRAPRSAGMRGRIRIATTNAVAVGPNGARTLPELYLYLDGRLMTGARATLVDTRPETWEVELRRDSAGSPAWQAVLGSPAVEPRAVRAGLGPAGGPEYARGDRAPVTLSLVVLREAWVWITGLLWGAVLVLFVVLAATTGIIRDSAPPETAPGPEPQGMVPPANPRRRARWEKYRRRPFSLGRFQMAFWFFVVTTSYLAVWLATGDHGGVITWQSLLLLGLATSTGAAARIVESRRRAEQEAAAPQREQLVRRVHDAHGLAPAGGAGDRAPADAGQAAHESAREELRALDADTPDAPWSKGFFRDILNDRDEPSLARFQHFAWTLILGVVFLNAVYRTLALPTLEPVLLVLLGISGATYIGFKGVEHHT